MRIVIFTFFGAVLCFSSIAGTDTLSYKKLIQYHADSNHFEGTVLIAEKGKITHQSLVGFRNIDRTEAITDNTKFGIASITKMFTAILILQLIEEDKLGLDSNLKQLLPQYDIPNAGKITIHDLMLHISGLPNESDMIFLSPKNPGDFVRQTLKNKKNRYGSFNYANIDYILLGLIISEITGKSWEESIEERIIQKFGMGNTGFLNKGDYPDNFAYTFRYEDKQGFKEDPLFHIENYWAAGNMFSTAADLLILDQALHGTELLAESSKKLLYTSYPEYNYSGYSVWTYNYPFAEGSPRIMERRGGILGSNSVLVRFLDSNKTLIILSNNDQFNPDSFGDSNNLKEALIQAMEVGN